MVYLISVMAEKSQPAHSLFLLRHGGEYGPVSFFFVYPWYHVHFLKLLIFEELYKKYK